MDDLLDHPSTAYVKMSELDYEAEKGLLELYRNFVSEMLKISLAGVAVLGFLSKLAPDGNPLPPNAKLFGTISMFSFAGSSALCLLFLFLSAEGYRWYVAGVRSTLCGQGEPEEYLKKRKRILRFCASSKLISAILIAIGALSASYSIWLAYLK